MTWCASYTSDKTQETVCWWKDELCVSTFLLSRWSREGSQVDVSAELDACNGLTSQSEVRGEVSSGTGAPPDRMIARCRHFSPSPCNYFQMHGRFQPPASWWQGTPQGIAWHGTVQLSPLLALTSSPPPVTLISHRQNPVWFVFESIYMPRREYLVSSFPYSALKSSHPMNHSFFSFFFFFFISLVSTC